MAKSFFFLVGLFFCWGNAQAEEARIAVASNFSKTMMELKRVFETSEPHSLSLIFGSTGKLYAQIRNGAPFDILLSADQEAPRALYESSAEVYGEPFTYAIGKIALWSSWQGLSAAKGPSLLESNDFRKLALANPRLAPYGRAAVQVLRALNLEQKLSSRLVYGESASQTHMLVATKNAELGFIPFSFIFPRESIVVGSYWLVPKDLYDPVIQDGILIRKENEAAISFINFLDSPEARDIVERNGFDVP